LNNVGEDAGKAEEGGGGGAAPERFRKGGKKVTGVLQEGDGFNRC